MKPSYYNAPIELYRGLMDNPKTCLDNVLFYLATLCVTKEQIEAETLYGVTYGGEWSDVLKIGWKLREMKFSGTLFSIPYSMFWDYHNNIDTKTDNDLLDLLGYLALKTKQGRKKLHCMTTHQMFVYMAGYSSKTDFDKREDDLGKIGTYFENERKQRDIGKRIRDRLEQKHNFHHVKGNRNFVYTFSNQRREVCLKMLIEYVETHKRSHREQEKREIIASLRSQYKRAGTGKATDN